VRRWAKPLFFANRHEPGCKKTQLFELKSRVDTIGRSAQEPLDGGGLESGQSPYIWRLLTGMIPPVSHLVFDSNFSIREIAQKSRVFCRDSVGGMAKNEGIFEKFRFYMVRIFFRRAKYLFQIGILGILGQHDQIRPQNAPKQAKMDKNGQSRSKTYFSDDAVPPCSQTAMHTFCRHTRTFPGYFVAVSTIFIIFLTHFKAFLGHFWPFLALYGMPCFGHFWPFWPIFPLKTVTFVVEKKSCPCRINFFQKLFRFWPYPQPSLCKKHDFFERSRVSKNSSQKQGDLQGGIM